MKLHHDSSWKYKVIDVIQYDIVENAIVVLLQKQQCIIQQKVSDALRGTLNKNNNLDV